MNHLGTVKELWRFPLKSMRGEKVSSAYVSVEGMLGDRAYALLDVELDKLVSGKSLRRFPNIFSYRARLVEEPVPGGKLPAVEIDMPGGRLISSADENVDTILSESLGQNVRLIREGEHKDLPYHDAEPISLLTESTLDRFRELDGKGDFDVRRFRMNIIIESDQPGFIENDWVGSALAVGDKLKVDVIRPNVRCVMTTLPQDELPHDRELFRAILKHNGLEIEGRPQPCAGVYAHVTAPGVVAVGQDVLE